MPSISLLLLPTSFAGRPGDTIDLTCRVFARNIPSGIAVLAFDEDVIALEEGLAISHLPAATYETDVLWKVRVRVLADTVKLPKTIFLTVTATADRFQQLAEVPIRITEG